MTEYDALNPMQQLLVDLSAMGRAFRHAAPAEDQAKAEKLHDKVINLLNEMNADDITMLVALGAVLAQVIHNDLEAHGELGPCLEPPPPQQSVN